MLKKTITYTDFDQNVRTEDFYFNLSKTEILELQLGVSGGLSKMLHKIISAQDSAQLIKWFKKIILISYGEKSADGKRFMKNDEITTAFTETEAYSQLFMELATDADAASKFVNGIIPAEAVKNVPNNAS